MSFTATPRSPSMDSGGAGSVTFDTGGAAKVAVQAQNYNVHGNTTINIQGNDPGLDDLPQASQAAFDASNKQHMPPCLRDTRRGVLAQIRGWADGSAERRLYWLRGMAGTGKSTIALTVAREYHERNRLLASFFFSRGSGDVGSAAKFATTVAGQLADFSPDLRSHVCEAMRSTRLIRDIGLYYQWERLVLAPLSRLDHAARPSPLVLVVDALDECEDEDDIQTVVQCLAGLASHECDQVRVLVTSRPEHPIRLGFGSIPDDTHRDFVLHDIEKSVVDEDISIYYRQELGNIAKACPLGYCEGDIASLVRRSAGLFIHAATVCRFVRDGRPKASERLSHLLKAGQKAITAEMPDLPRAEQKAKKAEMQLDDMYTTVLECSLTGQHQLDDEEAADVRGLYRRIVGSIVVLFDAVSPTTLATMVETPKQDVLATLSRLQAVLDVPETEDRSIRLLHPSFRDFLLDGRRCRSPQFVIDPVAAHFTLAGACLRLMSTSLRRDMCRLRRPGVRAREVKRSQVDENISPAVQYACRYWVYHLERSNKGGNKRGNTGGKKGSNAFTKHLAAIRDFLEARFLFWLEALSLMGRLSEGIEAIRRLEATIMNLKSTSRAILSKIKAGWERFVAPDRSPSLAKVIYDARRFMLSNGSIIEEAPLQAYCSALVFSPTESITRRNFWNQVPGWIIRSPETSGDWNPYLQTLRGHEDSVSAVAFSANGRLIASGSSDKTIRIWDATTGSEQRILRGHEDLVRAVAFSANGRLIASGSDDETIRIWDATTGSEQRILRGHEGRVMAVAFSANGRLIASGSSDKTIRIWDATTGSEQRILRGHEDWVRAVAFSANGRLIASGSNDETIRIWDATTGSEQRILRGHEDSVWAVAFSANGRLIASGSNDKTIRIWDATTGSEQYVIVAGFVKELSFTSTGQYLLTDRGLVSLPPKLPSAIPSDVPAETVCYPMQTEVQAGARTPSTNHGTSAIFVTERWVMENGDSILLLHPDYLDRDVMVAGSLLVFSNSIRLTLVLGSGEKVIPES